jgi:hypothetical protein
MALEKYFANTEASSLSVNDNEMILSLKSSILEIP